VPAPVQPPAEDPPLVSRARALAAELGFPLTREQAGPDRPSASLPAVGRFLAMLAAGCLGGMIAEIGTGVGVGAAWMASAMPADCSLITAEIDHRLAAAAARLFEHDDRVHVLGADARAVLPGYAPFDLLFADGGLRDPAELSSMVSLLRPGGRIVMDDVTPSALLPAASPLLRHDVKRQLFFGDARLVSAEVVLPDLRTALLVGTRRAWRRRPSRPGGAPARGASG
jgi:predicted O-methyltransferase YrrM